MTDEEALRLSEQLVAEADDKLAMAERILLNQQCLFTARLIEDCRKNVVRYTLKMLQRMITA